MATRRAAQLTIAYDPEGRKQTALGTQLNQAWLTKAFPATSRNYIDVEENNLDILDCTNEDFLFELLQDRIARLTIDVNFDPDVMAPLFALLYGVASAPSAGTDEVQTLTITATGGTYKLTVLTGSEAQTTAPIAFDADAATIQAALEALSNVGAGDIVVAGAGPFTFTFAGALAGQDVNLITVTTFFLTGGTATMAVTTDGIGSEHPINRMTDTNMALTTLYVGFRDSDKQPVIFKDVAVDSIEVRAVSEGDRVVTATITLIGNADLEQSVGFTMPPCQNIIPIMFGDCKMGLGGIDYIAQNIGREFRYYFQNNVIPKYDGAGVDITRLVRADVRPVGFEFYILGEPHDANYNIGLAKSTLDAFLQLGPDGRNITCTAPSGLVRLATTPIRFGGNPAESEVALVVRPKKVVGDADTPTNVTATVAFASDYLATA